MDGRSSAQGEHVRTIRPKLRTNAQQAVANAVSDSANGAKMAGSTVGTTLSRKKNDISIVVRN